MALQPTDIKSTYPLPAYNYRVQIDGEDVAFSQVSGLSMSVETTTYKESQVGGGPGPNTMRMPAQAADVTITLQKGVVIGKSPKHLYDWISSININQVAKKDILISLLDEAGAPVISWKVLNAFPTSLEAPAFDASSNDAAIESLQLMADKIVLLEGEGPS